MDRNDNDRIVEELAAQTRDAHAGDPAFAAEIVRCDTCDAKVLFSITAAAAEDIAGPWTTPYVCAVCGGRSDGTALVWDDRSEGQRTGGFESPGSESNRRPAHYE